jgi:xylulokinase
LVGGGARSPLWAQLLASLLGVTLVTRQGGEAGGALGAARLAWLADGGTIDQVCLAPPVAQRFAPDAAEHARLIGRHARFTALYRAVAPLYPSA